MICYALQLIIINKNVYDTNKFTKPVDLQEVYIIKIHIMICNEDIIAIFRSIDLTALNSILVAEITTSKKPS